MGVVGLVAKAKHTARLNVVVAPQLGQLKQGGGNFGAHGERDVRYYDAFAREPCKKMPRTLSLSKGAWHIFCYLGRNARLGMIACALCSFCQ